MALLNRSGKPGTKKAYQFSVVDDVEFASRAIRRWQTEDPDELEPEAVRLTAEIIKVTLPRDALLALL